MKPLCWHSKSKQENGKRYPACMPSTESTISKIYLGCRRWEKMESRVSKRIEFKQCFIEPRYKVQIQWPGHGLLKSQRRERKKHKNKREKGARWGRAKGSRLCCFHQPAAPQLFYASVTVALNKGMDQGQMISQIIIARWYIHYKWI